VALVKEAVTLLDDLALSASRLNVRLLGTGPESNEREERNTDQNPDNRAHCSLLLQQLSMHRFELQPSASASFLCDCNLLSRTCTLSRFSP
jgi:hypothetical protein